MLYIVQAAQEAGIYLKSDRYKLARIPSECAALSLPFLDQHLYYDVNHVMQSIASAK